MDKVTRYGKSGTDVALLNSIMHVIIEEHLFDQEYIKHHTLGFEQLKEQGQQLLMMHWL